MEHEETEVASVAKQRPDQKQRVYLGGIDPSRGLQVNDVVTRIQNRLPTALLNDIHLGSTYSQFTVDNLETYETIHKMFHNVTWKGCKLTIEVARPHFLERLRLEREVENKPATTEDEVPKDEGNLLRRHWKVKRRYGEPFFAVDTKPYTTDSWETFARAAKRKRINATENVGKKDKYSSRHNRSILLRLDSLERGDVVKGVTKRSTPQPSEPSASEDSADSRAEPRSNSYVWTDDDESSDGGSDSSETEPDENVKPHAGTSSEGELSESSDERKKPAKNLLKSDAHSAMASEFASAVDFDESEDDEDDSHGSNDANSTSLPTAEAVDLDEDVDRNMSLLAELFGGTTTAPSSATDTRHPSVDVSTADTPTAQDEEVPKKKRKPIIEAPKMMRFDPTDMNAHNYLAESDSEEHASGNDDHEMGTTKGQLSWFDQEPQKSDPIYEQDKLEEVFKTSRESTAEQPGEQQASSTGIFSFGFEVSETQNESVALEVSEKDDHETTPRSEPQSLDDQATSRTSTAPMDPSTATVAPGTDERSTSASLTSPASLFDFPSDDVLQGMVRSFFFDGEYGRIMNDLDGWRRDPAVKEQWLKQRHTLTLDWRNKRKAAMERKKRRGPMNKRPNNTSNNKK